MLFNAHLGKKLRFGLEDVSSGIGPESAVAKDESSYLAGRKVAVEMTTVAHVNVHDSLVTPNC